MAALVVAAMAMVVVSVSLPKLRLPLTPRCTLSCAKQGAPCRVYMCESMYMSDCEMMVWCALVRILVAADKYVGRPDVCAVR